MARLGTSGGCIKRVTTELVPKGRTKCYIKIHLTRKKGESEKEVEGNEMECGKVCNEGDYFISYKGLVTPIDGVSDTLPDMNFPNHTQHSKLYTRNTPTVGYARFSSSPLVCRTLWAF